MNPIEIQLLVKDAVEQIKKVSQKWNAILPDKKVSREREKLPDFNPIYERSVRYKEMIEVHNCIDKKPVNLMKRRAPYEDDKQFEYRTDNWENTTMPYFRKGLGEINRIFTPSNYSINWTAAQSEEKHYFEKEIPVFGSLINYFEQIVIGQKIVDPNALLVVKPYHLPQKPVVDASGKTVMFYDDTQLIHSYPVIYGCESIVDYKEGVYAIVILEEKSMVEFAGKTVREGLIFEIYDSENIWRIEQYGKKVDWKFTPPEVYYPHMLGYVPCQKLKGFPDQVKMHVLYESYFIACIPQLNNALYNGSNLNMSITNHMFPQRVEYVDRCTADGCDWGNVYEEIDGIRTTNKCKSCNGTGGRIAHGPMMSKQITAPDSLGNPDNATKIPEPGVWYVGPDGTQLEFLSKKVESDSVGAFRFVNIDVSSSDVKGSETALGKQIDREGLFAFLMRISSEAFALLDFTYKTMGKMRYGAKFEGPEVAAPTSFQIRSEFDLMEELIEGKKAGLPEVAMRELIRQTMAKRFGASPKVEQYTNLILAVDRVVTLNQSEIRSALASGTIEKWNDILHTSASSFIDELLIETDGNFFNLDYEEQKKMLIDKAKEVESQINASQGGTTDDILSRANA